MAITTEYIKKYARGVLPKEEETLFYQSLLSVANFVIIRHFNNLSEEDRNDARSEAVTGALKALKKPFVDFTSFDALHYTYTTMRHSIHNYFRKYKDKEIATDPEMFDFMIENTHNPCFLFTQLLERIHKYYKSECDAYIKQYPQAEPFVVSFDDAILRMNSVDNILLHKAFKQIGDL